MILVRNAEDGRFVENLGALEKSLSRLVVCVGGLGEYLKDIVGNKKRASNLMLNNHFIHLHPVQQINELYD
jgi:hypothetical protein